MTSETKTRTELIGDRELTVERVFDAPRELVFEAYSTEEHLMNWWGPREWPLAVCNIDFRVGGIWHYCMRGPDGTEAWGRGDYVEIVRPERIVYDDAFSDADASIVPPVTRVTVLFEEQGEGRTLLKSIAAYASAEERQQVLDMGVIEGMTETLDRLEELLAKR